MPATPKFLTCFAVPSTATPVLHKSRCSREMGKWAPIAGLSVAVLALAGCINAGATPIMPDLKKPVFIPGVPKGYECPLVPNGLDPAGSIYRLDKNGTYYRVKDFSTGPAVMAMDGFRKQVPISNYALSVTQASSVGLSFNLLEKVLPGLSASGSSEFKKKMSVDITVENIVAEVIDDTVDDYIVDWFKANIKLRRGSKYFLVRESVKAGSVSYKLKQNDLATLGGKAQLEKLADGAANVTIRDNDGTFAITQKFSPPIPVCIKSAEIVVDTRRTRSSSEVSVSLKSADDTTVPTIKRVGQN